MFKANADLTKDEFVARLEKNALAVSLRYGNHSTVSYDDCAACAAVIVEAKAVVVGIMLNMCVSPRNRGVFRGRVIFEGNVIASHRMHIGVEDFRQSTDVYAVF